MPAYAFGWHSGPAIPKTKLFFSTWRGPGRRSLSKAKRTGTPRWSTRHLNRAFTPRSNRRNRDAPIQRSGNKPAPRVDRRRTAHGSCLDDDFRRRAAFGLEALAHPRGDVAEDLGVWAIRVGRDDGRTG